ncbi:MAG: CHAD domain-containing protein [Thiotrichales bacterium]
MPKLRKTYFFEEPQALGQLMQRLQAHYSMVRIHDATVECCWLDSFDWRLYRHNRVLTAITQPYDLKILTLAALDTGEVLARSICKKMPEFAEDLPTAGFIDEIAELLQPRKLLKQLTVDIKGTHWQLVDENGDALLNLTAQYLDFLTRSNEEPAILVVTAQPGAEARAKPLLKSIAKACELKPVKFREQTSRLFSTGQVFPESPKDTHAAEILRTDAATVAVKKILSRHLSVIESNLGGAILDLDSEFLHDLRVALRRSRSILSASRHLFPPAESQRLIAEMKWAFRETNPHRDLDVLLLTVPEFEKQLPDFYRGEITFIERFVSEQKTLLQPNLSAHLKSDRFHQLLADWQAFIEKNTDPQGESETVESFAARKIFRTYKKLRRQARKLNKSSTPTEFHELRKSAKKHRYLLEAFEPLFPKKRLQKPLKRLKSLQNALGAYQDSQIQITSLIALGRELRHDPSARAETLMALGIISDRLLNRQARIRKQLLPLIQRFGKQDIAHRYEAIAWISRKPSA